jgi:threonine dehydrogenase-like Zn-dependent dehydrogenase
MSSGQNQTMQAVVFEFSIPKLAVSKLRGMIDPGGYWKPGGAVSLKQVPVPTLPADDWVLVKTAFCGICGSDMMELTLSGAPDNPLRTFITFPQIMGHEPAGVVESAGAKVKRVKPGDRVAVSPWFCCASRGIKPECPRCQEGDYTHCKNLQRGQLPGGMHLGVVKGFGGFAEYFAVHESQCFVIPEGVAFEAGVFADPFAVAFHSIISLQPDPNDLVLVYGLGIIGLATVMLLKKVFGVRRVVAVGRYPFQKELARGMGAERVFTSSGPALVEEMAAFTGAELYTPDKGSKWMMDGVDGVIDSIGSWSTLETGMRILRTQGRLVFTGVSTPKRCENTPHYFKELSIIGSNSFAIEYFQGKRGHAIEFFLDFLNRKLIDPAPLLTHKFALRDYQKAFDALAGKTGSRAVKVAFDFTK